MAVTLLDVIGQALRDIGVLASGETPAAQDAEDARLALNNLIDQWKAESLAIYSTTRTTATLTASQASFTVGPGGNINVAERPAYIDSLAYIVNSLSPALEIPIPVMNQGAWANIALKALTSSLPAAAYYEPTFPLGTLYPYPISTGASLLWAVYLPTPVAEFAAVSDAISLPPGYRRMIVTNLAKELCRPYGKALTQDLRFDARESMTSVKRANAAAKPRYMGFDQGSMVNGPSTFNIFTGS